MSPGKKNVFNAEPSIYGEGMKIGLWYCCLSGFSFYLIPSSEIFLLDKKKDFCIGIYEGHLVVPLLFINIYGVLVQYLTPVNYFCFLSILQLFGDSIF